MAVEDTPPPPPSSIDKIIPFSIPNKVPIKLDLEKHNYNFWSSFSLIHLGSLMLKSHVEEDNTSTNPEWCQLDDLIKMWILGSLCNSLQEQVVTTLSNAKALWDYLKKLFHDNKDARAINLDNELRFIKIGNMTVNEYCTKIQAMTNRLKNLDCEVSEKNMVIFAVNGLDSRFATLEEIIRRREPHLTFETVRNMLLLKELSFNDHTNASTTFESSSSSLAILMASSSNENKGNPNSQSKSPNNLQLFNHLNKGTYKFGERCKFIHDHQNQAGLIPQNHNSRTNTAPATVWWGSANGPATFGFSQPRQPTPITHVRLNTYQHSPTAYIAQPVYHTSPGPSIAAQQPIYHQTQPNSGGQAHHQAAYPVQQYYSPGLATMNNSGLLGAAPALCPSQPTSIPSAFSTMSLQDPTWNMDTGAC
ncbi:hybrid signal transduction histidine kinase M [Tanacetum coccineum]